jgi:hypothetical protein
MPKFRLPFEGEPHRRVNEGMLLCSSALFVVLASFFQRRNQSTDD